MTDFPTARGGEGRRGILSVAQGPISDYFTVASTGYANVASVWTADRAVYQPVCVSRAITVYGILVNVVTQDGNLDVGIYNWDDTKVVSLGSTAVGAAGIQFCDIADTALSPGWYKLAFASDSGTAVFRNANVTAPIGRSCAIQEQASAFPLPSPGAPTTLAAGNWPVLAAAYRTTA